MALYLHNSNAMNMALTAFNKNQSQLENVYTRLSSGLRINSAKDDPAGLQISDRMTSEINGYIQGSRNTQDGISVAQTAEGALDETKNMLQRIRTLAVQAANGTNTDTDRASINAEVAQLSLEITRIACKTTYAGARILAGIGKGSLLSADGMISIQVSGHANEVIKISGLSAGFTLSALSLRAHAGSSVFLKGKEGMVFDVSTASGAQNVLSTIDKVINVVSSTQGTLGGVQQRFESVIRLNSTMRNNMTDARSRILDTDYAECASSLANLTVLSQLLPSLYQQINNQRSLVLQLLQN